ncbi:MAG: DUF6476 family protein [Pseudomonadota bacterium]
MSVTSDMDSSEAEIAEPANLRFLRRLVTVLTAVMIAGVVVIVALLVIRLQTPPAPALALPETITLPEGAVAEAFTQGAGWYGVVTTDQRLLIFDSATGTLTQTVQIQTGG